MNKKEPLLQGFSSGLDGSRTHVRKPIPRPSTIIVSYLHSLRHTKTNILIPSVASSYARIRKAQYTSFPIQSMPDSLWIGTKRLTAATRQRMLNYLQRLILILRLTCRNGLLLQFQKPRRNLDQPLFNLFTTVQTAKSGCRIVEILFSFSLSGILPKVNRTLQIIS